MPYTVRARGPLYTFEIKSTTLYDWHATLATYSFGWQYDGAKGYVWLCKHCIAKIKPLDNHANIYIYCESNDRCWEYAVNELRDVLGVYEDLSEYIRLGKGDPLVGGLLEAMPGLHLRRTSIWYAFLVAVCQQNASFKQGWNMLYKLHLIASDRLIVEDKIFLEPPKPLNLNREVLRKAGLGYRASTVLEAVQKQVYNLSCDDIDRLEDVRGVGSYTLNLVRVLACRDYNALPLDRWLKRLAAEAYNVQPNDVYGEFDRRFKSWKGLAAIHTTIAFDAEPLRRALERLKRGDNKPGLVEPSPLTLWKYTPAKV